MIPTLPYARRAICTSSSPLTNQHSKSGDPWRCWRVVIRQDERYIFIRTCRRSDMHHFFRPNIRFMIGLTSHASNRPGVLTPKRVYRGHIAHPRTTKCCTYFKGDHNQPNYLLYGGLLSRRTRINKCSTSQSARSTTTAVRRHCITTDGGSTQSWLRKSAGALKVTACITASTFAYPFYGRVLRFYA